MKIVVAVTPTFENVVDGLVEDGDWTSDTRDEQWLGTEEGSGTGGDELVMASVPHQKRQEKESLTDESKTSCTPYWPVVSCTTSASIAEQGLTMRSKENAMPGSTLAKKMNF